MNAVTVLTPTYNRAHALPKLYESLLSQTATNFEWLIVDDGSKGDTQALVEGWTREGKLSMRYVKRENGGKHRALNTGLTHIQTPLTFIVDSDDTLTQNAIAEVNALYKQYGLRSDLCGYSFMRRLGKDGDRLAASPLKRDGQIGTFAKVRIKDNNPGDMAEVWFTDILRRFPFPEFEGEKFYSETGVWLRMSGPYALVYVNTPIYECEYYADGLTKNRRKSQNGSPRGVLDCSKQLMKRQCGLRWNVRGALRYCVFAHRLGMSFGDMAKESKRPLLACLCMPLSLPLRKRWRQGESV